MLLPLLPWGEGRGEGKIKTPRTCHRRAGHKRTLLWLTDFHDLNIIRAAGGFHFHGITDLVI